MKHRNEAGYSLVEVLVAITILAAVVLPTCSALVLGIQLNGKTDRLMRAQLAVSSAVETLMAEGIPSGTLDTAQGDDYGASGIFDRFPEVTITVKRATAENQNGETVDLPYYNVTVASSDMTAAGGEDGTSGEALVTVTTTVAASPTEPTETTTEATTETTTEVTDPGEGGAS